MPNYISSGQEGQRHSGLFIALEGCEGVGKSTQSLLLKEYFLRCGKNVVFTREPGGTAAAEQIRNIILSPNSKIDAFTELMLYLAARRSHVKEVILPALKAGKIVICDRFIHSTLAYQGYGRGIELDLIRSLNGIIVEQLEISIVLFFDLDPVQGFLRKGGADRADRMDSESMAFHSRVYKGFKEIAASESNVAAIDCGGDKDQTFKNILDALKGRGLI